MCGGLIPLHNYLSFMRIACPRGVLGVWRGRLAYTAPASGAPRGYKTVLGVNRDWLP